MRGEGDDQYVKPFLKWAGSKSQLLPVFSALYPPAAKVERYLEPFVGCGAVFFQVQALLKPKHAILCDNNAELIATFCAVRDRPQDVIAALNKHAKAHSEEYFYKIRAQQPSDPMAIAARLIYLNKTCFNGLYRVNSKGGFNVPFGHRTNPSIVIEDRLLEISRVLKGVEIRARDFREIPDHAKPGDFIYFDPPYHPMSGTAYFTSYTSGEFIERDQRDLADVFARLDRMGCLLMLSNSDVPLMEELYGKYVVHKVQARRMINSNGEKRGPVSEVVVCNYGGATVPAERKKSMTPSPAPPRPGLVHLHKGDAGETQLASGERVRKDALRIECCGTVDELSSYIGLARAALLDKDKPKGSASLNSTLKRVQRELYCLGTQLATAEGGNPPRESRAISDDDVAQLDREIAENDAQLPRLRSFILPGGGVVASHLHVARAICRRAERQVVRLFAEEAPMPNLIPYLNRLSLALFSMARVACQLFSEDEDLV